MGKLFKKIREIQFATDQLATDLLAGAYHSAFRGRGMEFEEVREYQTGDEIRSIDWNVTARMNHPFVKVFCEERQLTVMLLVDVSASSRFGSQNKTKKEMIAEVAAVIAFSAIKNNDKVGLILFSEEVELFLPPQNGVRHVLRVIRELLMYQPRKFKTDLSRVISFFGNVRRKSAICFLISDFICDLREKELLITSQHNDLIAIHVSDPAEWELTCKGFVEMTDLETGVSAIVREQKGKMRERSAKVQSICKKIGAGYICLKTDQPWIDPIRKFFKLRGIKR